MPDILRIEDLRVGFAMRGGAAEVVKGVSLRVPAGKTVALVGESGSGKTVISQSVMGLLPKNGIILAPWASCRLCWNRAGGPAATDRRSGRCGAPAWA